MAEKTSGKAPEKGEEKKKSHTGRNVAIGAVIAALLGAGYFGLGGPEFSGGGSGNGGGTTSIEAGSSESGRQEKTTEATEASSTEQAGVTEIVIAVSENDVLANGKKVTLTALEELLLKDYREGVKVTVKDDSAIKGAYDDVTALLKKLEIPFGEE